MAIIEKMGLIMPACQVFLHNVVVSAAVPGKPLHYFFSKLFALPNQGIVLLISHLYIFPFVPLHIVWYC